MVGGRNTETGRSVQRIVEVELKPKLGPARSLNHSMGVMNAWVKRTILKAAMNSPVQVISFKLISFPK